MANLTTAQIEAQFGQLFNTEENKVKIAEKREAWLKEKGGKIGASKIGSFFTRTFQYADSKESRGLISELARTRYALVENQDLSWVKAIRRGNEKEPIAVLRMMKETGLKVIKWGDGVEYGDGQKFVPHPKFKNYAGATADGIILENRLLFPNLEGNGVLEVKCPNTETHEKYLKWTDGQHLKKGMYKYYLQMQMQMICNGLKWGIFESFDDRMNVESKQANLIVVREDLGIQAMINSAIYNAKIEIEKLVSEQSQEKVIDFVSRLKAA